MDRHHAHLFDIIPREVFEFWSTGRYRPTMQHSREYANLGQGLSLRGLYRYTVYQDELPADALLSPDKAVRAPRKARGPSNTEMDASAKSTSRHGGYCFIDFADGELYVGGLRIWTAKGQSAADYDHPLFFRSDMSRFIGSGDNTRFVFIYRLLPKPQGGLQERAEALRLRYLQAEFPGRFREASEQLRLRHGETGLKNKDARRVIVDYLLGDYDTDCSPDVVQSLSAGQPITGFVSIDLPAVRTPKNSMRGLYAGIGEQAVGGRIVFQRVATVDPFEEVYEH
jgi:hypothetical protein